MFNQGRRPQFSCLYFGNKYTFIAFASWERKLLFHSVYILFRWNLASLKIRHNLQRSLNVFSSQRAFVFVGSDNLRHVEDVVPWGIGIPLERMQLFMLRDLCDQPFKSVLLLLFDLFFKFCLAEILYLFWGFFSSSLFVFLFFPKFLLLFLLQILLHLGDLLFKMV